MHSWEILEQRQKRLLLAILQTPDLGVTLDYSQGLRNLQLPPGSDFLKVVGLPYGPARNNAAKTCVDGGYGALAFLDADVRPLNNNIFIKLWETGLELISGLYYQKFPPFMPVAFNQGIAPDGKPVRQPVLGWRPADIIACDFIPMGATLIRRRVLELAFEKFKRPFIWSVDTAPVPDYNGQPLPEMSEDFLFTWRCKTELNIQPYVHTGQVALHEIRGVVGPKWILPTPHPEPLYGIAGVF